MNRIFRSAVFYLVLIILVVWVYNLYRASSSKPETLTVNDFVTRLEGREIESVKFLTRDEKGVGDLASGEDARFEVYLPHDTIDEYQQIPRSDRRCCRSSSSSSRSF
jgi:ATP-dependent Zn protease